MKQRKGTLRKDIEHCPFREHIVALRCKAWPWHLILDFQVAGRSLGQSPHAALNACKYKKQGSVLCDLVKRVLVFFYPVQGMSCASRIKVEQCVLIARNREWI